MMVLFLNMKFRSIWKAQQEGESSCLLFFLRQAASSQKPCEIIFPFLPKGSRPVVCLVINRMLSPVNLRGSITPSAVRSLWLAEHYTVAHLPFLSAIDKWHVILNPHFPPLDFFTPPQHKIYIPVISLIEPASDTRCCN